MGKNGNAPKALAKTTQRGVPLVSLFVTFVVGLIVFLPFPSWQQLVGFITSATVLSFGVGADRARRDAPPDPRPRSGRSGCRSATSSRSSRSTRPT